ncbi:MAG: GDP-mannose 4,6-dehydratase [Victivallaceae bacterium]|nr:GDP-mannose 4,6-dehydratase [Victivallaceae bacterium]
MKYLITGGAGFIGGYLAEALIAKGNQVTVIDDLSTGSMDNLAAIIDHPDLTFVEGDILSMDGLEAMAGQNDYIFHLAAAVGVELVVHDPIKTIETNIHGTERILKAASKFDKRILVASTSEVYGKSTNEQFSESDDLLIGPSSISRWSYACSKLLDEFFVMAYCQKANLQGTVVRLFNTVGPRQTGQYGMVVPRFVASAVTGEDITVYGTGEQTRCFCHVLDTVNALQQLADNPDSIGKLFNVGSHNKVSILQLAQQIIKQLNSSSKIVFIPYEQAYEKGFEDMLHRAPNTSLIKDFIGWEAERSLEQIIDDVAVYFNNRG